MTTQTKAGNPSPGNRIELYTTRKQELIREITFAVQRYIFGVVDEMTVLLKDVVLEGTRIHWTDYVSSTPEYLKWTAAAIQTATGMRHPDVPEDVAIHLRAVFKDLTSRLSVQGLSVEYDEGMGTWRVRLHEMDLELALLNEMGFQIEEPITLYFDSHEESPSTYIPVLGLLDTEDVERYYAIFQRTWKPALVWLQFRSSNDNE